MKHPVTFLSVFLYNHVLPVVSLAIDVRRKEHMKKDSRVHWAPKYNKYLLVNRATGYIPPKVKRQKRVPWKQSSLEDWWEEDVGVRRAWLHEQSRNYSTAKKTNFRALLTYWRIFSHKPPTPEMEALYLITCMGGSRNDWQFQGKQELERVIDRMMSLSPLLAVQAVFCIFSIPNYDKHYFSERLFWLLSGLRNRFALSGEADAKPLMEAAAPYRERGLYERLTSSFLFPSRSDWAEVDVACVLAMEQNKGTRRSALVGGEGYWPALERLTVLLLASGAPIESLTAFAVPGRVSAFYLSEGYACALNLIFCRGVEASPVIAGLVDRLYSRTLDYNYGSKTIDLTKKYFQKLLDLGTILDTPEMVQAWCDMLPFIEERLMKKAKKGTTPNTLDPVLFEFLMRNRALAIPALKRSRTAVQTAKKRGGSAYFDRIESTMQKLMESPLYKGSKGL